MCHSILGFWYIFFPCELKNMKYIYTISTVVDLHREPKVFAIFNLQCWKTWRTNCWENCPWTCLLWKAEELYFKERRCNQLFLQWSHDFVGLHHFDKFWWPTGGTNSNHPANLILKNDGNLVINSEAGDSMWTTNTTALCSGLIF